MTDEKKPTKIVFALGCFDHLEFENQEELDDLVKQIQDMFDSGEAQVRAISVDELIEHMSDEDIEKLLTDLGVDIDEGDISDITDITPQDSTGNRTLH